VRVKKRVKKGIKKGVKSVKSSPEVYLTGAGLVVGGAAVVLLATTKSGQELLARTAQLVLQPAPEEEEAQEADVQEDAESKPPEDADVEDDAEEDPNGDEESEVTDLKSRSERSSSARKRPAPRKAGSA
jgi:hypothetical protein